MTALDALNELDEVWAECQKPNWDGYGAKPVMPRTLRAAQQFVKACGPTLSPTSTGAEPDGCITIEWYASDNHLMSVSIHPDGKILYFVSDGQENARGSCQFNGVLPDAIAYWIKRVRP